MHALILHTRARTHAHTHTHTHTNQYAHKRAHIFIQNSHTRAAARRMVHQDGGKWVCDAYRISELQSCIVISIGSKNDWTFEEAVHHLNPVCRIYTFDHTITPRNKPDYVTFQQLGLAVDNNADAKLVTLHRALASVGLQNSEKIDLFKIDCEGCEYDIFPQFFNVVPALRQVLIELHGVTAKNSDTHVNQIFNGFMDNGYAIFHKEPNTLGCKGSCIEYGFIKLAKGFSDGLQERVGSASIDS
mmetsp:Transcript_13637/g.21609  ORF Transcript_13637/g.21609 Transcript_13637/m.21609 type:complete len:244 (-) Transcript_13637:78-809(-)